MWYRDQATIGASGIPARAGLRAGAGGGTIIVVIIDAFYLAELRSSSSVMPLLAMLQTDWKASMLTLLTVVVMMSSDR